MRTAETRRKRLATTWVLLSCLLATGSALARGARPASAQPRDGKAEVVALLQEFLAKVTSRAMHERFWADDIIYVSNAGVVRTKVDILRGMKTEEPAAPAGAGWAAPAAPSGGYSAEDIAVRQFGEAVVLNFRLVQHASGRPDIAFRNSGVFVQRNGRWQAVSWQATKMAPQLPQP